MCWERWDKGQQVIFTANPKYYGRKPSMERVVVVFMDEDAALAAVQKGEVDIAYTYVTHARQAFEGYELAAYKTVDSRGVSLPSVPAWAALSSWRATWRSTPATTSPPTSPSAAPSTAGSTAMP